MKLESTMAAASCILLFLLAGLAAADGDAIRLPSNGGESETHGAAAWPTGRPWDCCDNAEISPVFKYPPLYRCTDEVKQCSPFCHDCQQVVRGGFPRGRYVCNDWFSTNDPGPLCTVRPWGPCCDFGICALSEPPVCHCDDEVEACYPACKQCERVDSWSWRPLYVCRDSFRGEPGPRCTP